MTTGQDSAPEVNAVAGRPRLVGLRTTLALVLREMSSSYGRSPGGYVWVVLEPLLGIALLSAIFSLGFKSPRLGENFAIFYATGLLPFFLFIDTSNKTARAIIYSTALLGYPRVTFLDTIIARYLLSLLTQLIVFALIITGILMIWDTRTTLEIDRILLSLTMAAMLGLGVGLLNCFLMTMFPIWQNAWSIMTRPLFIISGILILYESVPEPYSTVLWYNPLLHVTGEMRAAFYLSYNASYVSPLYVFTISLVCALIGMVFLRRYHRDMMER